MKIIRIHEYGGPENLILEDAPAPAAGPGQLLIKVAASSVNPVDWKVCGGALRALPNFSLPLTPGGDVAGTIAVVGEEVEGWTRDDEVYSFIGLTGAYAEFVAIDAAIAARKPKNLSFEQAATIPLAGLTAWQGLLKDGRDLAGLHVLVHAASGGVGSFAVQIAKAKGARVTATASAKNADFVRGLGADTVLDFRVTPVSGQAQDIDIVIDCVGDTAAFEIWPLIKSGGSLIRLGAGRDDPKPAEEAGVRVMKMQVQPNAGQLAEIAALVEAGAIRPAVAQIFPLEEVAQAHAVSKAGHVQGKIAISVK